MFKKIIVFFISFCFAFEQVGFAQIAGQLDISARMSSMIGSVVYENYRPVHLRYLSYDQLNNDFKLLLDKGSVKETKPEALENTASDLLKYFFVGVNLPNGAFWVNLRPDSPKNMIDEDLAKTDMGKVMLEADLQLKKDTAKYTSPETLEGREYWDKLYKKAEELYGSENITIPTLTRPWIVPSEIIVREAKGSAYIYKATLKVMLEQDYLKSNSTYNFTNEKAKLLNEYSSQIIRESIIPKLTREVNSSKRYSSLRQVYYSLILAQWFKDKYKANPGVYSGKINTKNLTNLTSKNKWDKDAYFKSYQKSFKDGEYNIREARQSSYGQTIRTYFSGGVQFTGEQILSLIQASLIQSSARFRGIPAELKKYYQAYVAPDGSVRVEQAVFEQPENEKEVAASQPSPIAPKDSRILRDSLRKHLESEEGRNRIIREINQLKQEKNAQHAAELVIVGIGTYFAAYGLVMPVLTHAALFTGLGIIALGVIFWNFNRKGGFNPRPKPLFNELYDTYHTKLGMSHLDLLQEFLFALERDIKSGYYKEKSASVEKRYREILGALDKSYSAKGEEKENELIKKFIAGFEHLKTGQPDNNSASIPADKSAQSQKAYQALSDIPLPNNEHIKFKYGEVLVVEFLVTSLLLRSLIENDSLVFDKLVIKSRQPEYKLTNQEEAILKDAHLVNEDGAIPGLVSNIALSIVEGYQPAVDAQEISAAAAQKVEGEAQQEEWIKKRDETIKGMVDDLANLEKVNPEIRKQKVDNFRTIYQNLPDIAQRIAEEYRKLALERGHDDLGNIAVYMVGGRVRREPLKESSDIDIIVSVEKDVKNLGFTYGSQDHREAIGKILFSVLNEFKAQGKDLPIRLGQTYSLHPVLQNKFEFAGQLDEYYKNKGLSQRGYLSKISDYVWLHDIGFGVKLAPQNKKDIEGEPGKPGMGIKLWEDKGAPLQASLQDGGITKEQIEPLIEKAFAGDKKAVEDLQTAYKGNSQLFLDQLNKLSYSQEKQKELFKLMGLAVFYQDIPMHNYVNEAYQLAPDIVKRIKQGNGNKETMRALMEEKYQLILTSLAGLPEEQRLAQEKKLKDMKDLLDSTWESPAKIETLESLFTILSAWAALIRQQKKDYHRLYLLRDAGLFKEMEDVAKEEETAASKGLFNSFAGLLKLNQMPLSSRYDAGSSVYYLSRDRMSGDDYRVNHSISDQMTTLHTTARYQAREERDSGTVLTLGRFYVIVRELFRERYNNDEKFHLMVDNMRRELVEAGYDKKDKLLIVDNGKRGTVAFFLKNVLDLGKNDAELVGKDGKEKIQIALLEVSSEFDDLPQIKGSLLPYDLALFTSEQRKRLESLETILRDKNDTYVTSLGIALEHNVQAHPVHFSLDNLRIEKSGPAAQLVFFFEQLLAAETTLVWQGSITGKMFKSSGDTKDNVEFIKALIPLLEMEDRATEEQPQRPTKNKQEVEESSLLKDLLNGTEKPTDGGETEQINGIMDQLGGVLAKEGAGSFEEKQQQIKPILEKLNSLSPEKVSQEIVNRLLNGQTIILKGENTFSFGGSYEPDEALVIFFDNYIQGYLAKQINREVFYKLMSLVDIGSRNSENVPVALVIAGLIKKIIPKISGDPEVFNYVRQAALKEFKEKIVLPVSRVSSIPGYREYFDPVFSKEEGFRFKVDGAEKLNADALSRIKSDPSDLNNLKFLMTCRNLIAKGERLSLEQIRGIPHYEDYFEPAEFLNEVGFEFKPYFSKRTNKIRDVLLRKRLLVLEQEALLRRKTLSNILQAFLNYDGSFDEFSGLLEDMEREDLAPDAQLILLSTLLNSWQKTEYEKNHVYDRLVALTVKIIRASRNDEQKIDALTSLVKLTNRYRPGQAAETVINLVSERFPVLSKNILAEEEALQKAPDKKRDILKANMEELEYLQQALAGIAAATVNSPEPLDQDMTVKIIKIFLEMADSKTFGQNIAAEAVSNLSLFIAKAHPDVLGWFAGKLVNDDLQKQNLMGLLTGSPGNKDLQDFLRSEIVIQDPKIGYLLLLRFQDRRDLLNEIIKDEKINISLRLYAFTLYCGQGFKYLDIGKYGDINSTFDEEELTRLMSNLAPEIDAFIQGIFIQNKEAYEDFLNNIVLQDEVLKVYATAVLFAARKQVQKTNSQDIVDTIYKIRNARLQPYWDNANSDFVVGGFTLARWQRPTAVFLQILAHEIMHDLLLARYPVKDLSSGIMHEAIADLYAKVFYESFTAPGDRNYQEFEKELLYQKDFEEVIGSNGFAIESHEGARAQLQLIQNFFSNYLLDLDVKKLMQLGFNALIYRGQFSEEGISTMFSDILQQYIKAESGEAQPSGYGAWGGFVKFGASSSGEFKSVWTRLSSIFAQPVMSYRGIEEMFGYPGLPGLYETDTAGSTVTAGTVEDGTPIAGSLGRDNLKDGGEGISEDQYAEVKTKIPELRKLWEDFKQIFATREKDAVSIESLPAFAGLVRVLDEKRFNLIQRNLEEGAPSTRSEEPLDPLIQQAKDKLSKFAETENVEIIISGTGYSLFANEAERRALVESLSELVNNAIKYSHPAGVSEKESKSIRIEANRLENGQIKISVTDQGIGLRDVNGNSQKDFWATIPKTQPSERSGKTRNANTAKGVYSGREGMGLVKYFAEDVLNNPDASKPVLFAEENPSGGSVLGFTVSPSIQRSYSPEDPAEWAEWEKLLMALGQSSRHDLKNLLTPIAGYAMMLEDDLRGAGDVQNADKIKEILDTCVQIQSALDKPDDSLMSIWDGLKEGQKEKFEEMIMNAKQGEIRTVKSLKIEKNVPGQEKIAIGLGFNHEEKKININVNGLEGIAPMRYTQGQGLLQIGDISLFKKPGFKKGGEAVYDSTLSYANLQTLLQGALGDDYEYFKYFALETGFWVVFDTKEKRYEFWEQPVNHFLSFDVNDAGQMYINYGISPDGTLSLDSRYIKVAEGHLHPDDEMISWADILAMLNRAEREGKATSEIIVTVKSKESNDIVVDSNGEPRKNLRIIRTKYSFDYKDLKEIKRILRELLIENKGNIPPEVLREKIVDKYFLLSGMESSYGQGGKVDGGKQATLDKFGVNGKGISDSELIDRAEVKSGTGGEMRLYLKSGAPLADIITVSRKLKDELRITFIAQKEEKDDQFIAAHFVDLVKAAAKFAAMHKTYDYRLNIKLGEPGNAANDVYNREYAKKFFDLFADEGLETVLAENAVYVNGVRLININKNNELVFRRDGGKKTDRLTVAQGGNVMFNLIKGFSRIKEDGTIQPERLPPPVVENRILTPEEQKKEQAQYEKEYNELVRMQKEIFSEQNTDVEPVSLDGGTQANEFMNGLWERMLRSKNREIVEFQPKYAAELVGFIAQEIVSAGKFNKTYDEISMTILADKRKKEAEFNLPRGKGVLHIDAARNMLNSLANPEKKNTVESILRYLYENDHELITEAVLKKELEDQGIPVASVSQTVNLRVLSWLGVVTIEEGRPYWIKSVDRELMRQVFPKIDFEKGDKKEKAPVIDRQVGVFINANEVTKESVDREQAMFSLNLKKYFRTNLRFAQGFVYQHDFKISSELTMPVTISHLDQLLHELLRNSFDGYASFFDSEFKARTGLAKPDSIKSGVIHAVIAEGLFPGTEVKAYTIEVEDNGANSHAADTDRKGEAFIKSVLDKNAIMPSWYFGKLGLFEKVLNGSEESETEGVLKFLWGAIGVNQGNFYEKIPGKDGIGMKIRIWVPQQCLVEISPDEAVPDSLTGIKPGKDGGLDLKAVQTFLTQGRAYVEKNGYNEFRKEVAASFSKNPVYYVLTGYFYGMDLSRGYPATPDLPPANMRNKYKQGCNALDIINGLQRITGENLSKQEVEVMANELKRQGRENIERRMTLPSGKEENAGTGWIARPETMREALTFYRDFVFKGQEELKNFEYSGRKVVFPASVWAKQEQWYAGSMKVERRGRLIAWENPQTGSLTIVDFIPDASLAFDSKYLGRREIAETNLRRLIQEKTGVTITEADQARMPVIRQTTSGVRADDIPMEILEGLGIYDQKLQEEMDGVIHQRLLDSFRSGERIYEIVSHSHVMGSEFGNGPSPIEAVSDDKINFLYSVPLNYDANGQDRVNAKGIFYGEDENNLSTAGYSVFDFRNGETRQEGISDNAKLGWLKNTALTRDPESRDGGDPTKKTTAADQPGGIDFRGLPIVNQPGVLPAAVGINQLPSVNIADLDGEWQQIEKMAASDMVPSTQRLKEFLGAACSKGALDKYAGGVLACIADIMRMEEEKAKATEPALREILILLESNRPDNELQQSLSFISVTAGEPQA